MFRNQHTGIVAVCLLAAALHTATVRAGPPRSSKTSRTRTTPGELDIAADTEKITCRNYGPKRTAPVFKGAFSVGVVLVEFPDTLMPPLNDIKEGLFNFKNMSVTDYFKEYSQNVSWPELLIVGEESFPKCVYKAPQPIGYYCEFDFWSNPLGYKDIADGHERANTLRTAAEKHAFSMFKSPPAAAGINLQNNRRPHIVCYAFAAKVVNPSEFKDIIRPRYNGLMKSYNKTEEAWDLYKPQIGWSDPLWPNSIPQVKVEDGGGTVCHELGHVIGAPDYYHAPEKFDGTPGTPSLDWAYGPTGPGHCRYIYNGFLKKENYPTLTTSGTYTLYPRKTNPAGDKAIGCFVPSAHPHYIYYLEYVKDEKSPLGNPDKQGMLVHVINTTLSSPLFGAPDLCYTYRPNDPWFRSEGDSGAALMGAATGRTSFSTSTDPASRLPNLMDGGMEIDSVSEGSESVTFKLTIRSKPLSTADYKYSLVPKIRLDEITGVLPTSMHADSTVLFRGEPMKSDYGFCWNTMPHPKIPGGSRITANATYFPLYHRDRYGARIIGLRPGTKYYVRAYARNGQGISYSDEELTITTPPLTQAPASVPPLLEDDFSGNWVIDRWYGEAVDSAGDFIGSSAITTLLKLTAYYRQSLDPEKAKAKDGIDYTRIHIKPSLNRPPARMKEFFDALHECEKLAKNAGMRENSFGKDFDKNITKVLAIQTSRSARTKPVEPLTSESIPNMEKQIIDSLVNAVPVVAGQDSVQLSPRGHGLSWVIIDGFNEQKQFHLVYPRNTDRDFNRKTGWYPLDTLLIDVNEAKLIFGLNPS